MLFPTTLLLSSLSASTLAQSSPSSARLDPEQWSAISTKTFAYMPALTPSLLSPPSVFSPSQPEFSLTSPLPTPPPSSRPSASTRNTPSSSTASSDEPQDQATPEDEDTEAHADLKRAEAVNPALSNAPTSATTYPATITTLWVQTQLPNGQTTYVEVIYTQLFSATPAPAQEAMTVAAGQVGLGTLTGEVGRLETSLAAKASEASAAAQKENVAAGLIAGRGRIGGLELVYAVVAGLGAVAVGMVLLV